MSKLFPHPVLSVSLFLVWLLLVNSAAFGHVLLAAVFATGIPLLMHGFWPERTPMHRPWLGVRLVARLLWDILIANVAVAKRVLGPKSALRPRFVTMDLDLRNDFAISVLTSIISLTPGTVSVDVSPDRRRLTIHCLDVRDPEALIESIKQRYEHPLGEIYR